MIRAGSTIGVAAAVGFLLTAGGGATFAVAEEPDATSGGTPVDQPTKQLVVRGNDLWLDVGEQKRVRVYRCDRRRDGASARLGRDGVPGTRDDRCKPERKAVFTFGPEVSLTPDARDASRIAVSGLQSGVALIVAEAAGAAGAADGTAVVAVSDPLPEGDPGAIGMRPRGSGDIDGDGRLTAGDADLLRALLDDRPDGYLASDDPILVPEANILGRDIISGLDVTALEELIDQAKVRRRAARRGEIEPTPRDIIPLEAGGYGVVGAMLDASGLGKLPGAFPVNNVGPGRLYFQGQGGWGTSGEVPGEIVLEQAGVMVFTVSQPGRGFVGHQALGAEFASTASYEAVTPGDPLALPAPSRRLSIPYDVDLDGDLDFRDFTIVASSMGMRAGDAGFPAAGDADADGVITLADAELLAPVIALANTGQLGGVPRSGDLDGDGDVDEIDARAAATHVTARPGLLAMTKDLLAKPHADAVQTFIEVSAGDVDGDGSFDAEDVIGIMDQVGLDPAELGPYYDFEAPDEHA